MKKSVHALARGLTQVTGYALGPYQTAVVRIGFAATWLLFLMRELPHRLELYGPDAPWSLTLAEQLLASNEAFTLLPAYSGAVWFDCVYALAMLSALLLLLGWRTRATSVLFMVGVLSLQNRSVFVGDGGDNVLHLMAIYLVFTRCAQVWSLDARRARRASRDGRSVGTGPGGVLLWSVLGAALVLMAERGAVEGGWLLFLAGLWVIQALWWLAGRLSPLGEARALGDVIANLVHNAALFVIMAEACLIYATAGWYKIQGSRWQDGTAVYYPLHLDYFSPWPGLSDLLTAHALPIMILTYGTVITQVAFPFTLLNRRVKNALLTLMILEHAAIAVVLGLPFFSLAMIAADAVFLPTVFLRAIGGTADRTRKRVRRRVRGAADATGPAGPTESDGRPGHAPSPPLTAPGESSGSAGHAAP